MLCVCARRAFVCVLCFRECARTCAAVRFVASAPAGQGRGGSEWMESVCVYVARCMMCVACCVLKVGCGPILRVAFPYVTHESTRTAALLQASTDVLPLLPANSTSERSARTRPGTHAHINAACRCESRRSPAAPLPPLPSAPLFDDRRVSFRSSLIAELCIALLLGNDQSTSSVRSSSSSAGRTPRMVRTDRVDYKLSSNIQLRQQTRLQRTICKDAVPLSARGR